MKIKFTFLISILLLGVYYIGFSQSTGYNYVKKSVVKNKDVKTLSEFYALSNDEKLETINYFDGLGRADQIVQKSSSPNSFDVVQPIKYDEFGRENLKYLPFVGNYSDGRYVDNWEYKIDAFYSISGDKIANTDHYFSETSFEPSPLNRVSEQGAPGYDWQIDENPVEYDYVYNTGSEIFYLTNTSGTWNYSSTDNYDENSLFVNQITDEDGNITKEFKDKEGKVILKESVLDGSSSACTYYAYDAFNNLSLVISPQGVEELKVTGGAFNLSDDFIDRWCYQYSYDSRHRMITKKIPGKKIEYFVYDILDRLALYQDGNLRDKGEWKFYKYDILGREVLAGICDYYDEFDQVSFQLRVTSNSLIFTESFDLNGTQMYTNNVEPDLVTYGEITNVIFYDNYDFDNTQFFTYYNEPYCQQLIEPVFYRVQGLVTGTKTLILDNSGNYIHTANYYDKYHRLIQQQSNNILGGKDVITTVHDFLGNPLDVFHRHNDGQKESYDIVEHTNYRYDHANRVTTVNYGLEEMFYNRMVENTYNELSQLVEKNLHSIQGERIQSIDYTYNVRGWLKKINNSDLQNDHTTIPADDLPTAIEQVDNMTISGLDFDINIVNAMGVSSLQAGFSDDKNLAISEIQNPSNIRNVAIDENKTVVYDTTGGQNTELFFRMMNYNTRSYSLDLGGFSIHAEDDLGPLLDSLSVTIANELKDLGITDPSDAELMATMCKQYLYGTIGIIHFNEDANDLFGMELYYTDNDYISSSDMSTIIPAGNYNGNIAGMRWKVDDGDIHGYGYEYDDLNRIVNADYGYRDATSWDAGNKFDVESIGYDLNGNIEAVKRYGYKGEVENNPWFGIIDDLSYNYIKSGKRSNKLRKVDDNELTNLPTSVDFFDNGVRTAEEYFYDDNGNMFRDDNKGILSITYNLLNLPEEIVFTSGDKINYLYDASSNKLKMTVTENNNITKKTEYAGKWVYNTLNGIVLDYLITPEGRVLASNGDIRNGKHEYYLTDHLGNTRAVIQQDPVVLSSAELMQESHYYPFGQEFVGLDATAGSNNYKYNGKELQQDLKLQWYDYGARFYDQQLGRWHVNDAYSEKYFDLSTYQYAANNPIVNIDINGDSIWFTNQYDKSGELTGVTMNVTGKVINMSDNDVDMETAAADISSQIESTFQGEDENGVTFNTVTDISVAENMDEVSYGDHLFVMSEIQKGDYEDATGAVNMEGGKVAFLDANYFTGTFDKNVGNIGQRSAAHEFGHFLGLKHKGGYNIMKQSGSEWYTFSTGTNSSQLSAIQNSTKNQGSPFGVGGLPNVGKMRNVVSLKQVHKAKRIFKLTGE